MGRSGARCEGVIGRAEEIIYNTVLENGIMTQGLIVEDGEKGEWFKLGNRGRVPGHTRTNTALV